MNFVDRVDPEIAAALEHIPQEMMDAIGEDPPTARAISAQMAEAMQGMLPATNVAISERTISGPNGDIPLVIYQPPGGEPRPGLLWLHGGGYVIGTARADDLCVPYAEHVGCTIVSVDYRLAPEHPFPAGMEDAFAALVWMADHTDELGIDPQRMAIGGASAGGGLAAGLALMNRDRKGPQIVFQYLLYPMLDDTHDTPSGNEITHPKVWNRDLSFKAWKMYLGDSYGTDAISPYAAPARASDLAGLPPAYLSVGTMDLFRDEDINYAKRLMAAGVATELEVIPGMYHAGEVFMPTASISARMRQNHMEALKRGLR